MRIRIQVEREELHRAGSPFGFTEQDWEYVRSQRQRTDELKVVLGYQFHSEHYCSEALLKHLTQHFERAIQTLNQDNPGRRLHLAFTPLGAGYGEHMFTDIVREIISADIGVFEVSDQNPNVMIELGVALSWGVKVWPIKKEGRPALPTDISGLTYSEYREDGRVFLSRHHHIQLVEMVERVMQRKREG